MTWVDRVILAVALLGAATTGMVTATLLFSGKVVDLTGLLLATALFVAFSFLGWLYWRATQSPTQPDQEGYLILGQHRMRQLAACFLWIRMALLGIGVTLFGVLLAFFIRDVMITGTVDAAARCLTVQCVVHVQGAHARTTWEAVGLIVVGAGVGTAIRVGRRTGKRERPEDTMMTDPLGDPRDRVERYRRFERLFRAHDVLGKVINGVLDERGELPLRDGEEDVSRFIGAAFGKANKTTQAIVRLCLLGYAEDAVVLLRTNVNLLIDAVYVLTGDRTERFKDFLAHSYAERVKMFREGYAESPPEPPSFGDDETKRRAKAWGSIRDRARALPDGLSLLHYSQGYRLYSTIEHSDAWGLSHYLTPPQESSWVAGSEESDHLLDLVLPHAWRVLADIFSLFCQYFDIERSAAFAELNRVWQDIGGESREARGCRTECTRPS